MGGRKCNQRDTAYLQKEIIGRKSKTEFLLLYFIHSSMPLKGDPSPL
jgi:hypothetical protein